MALEDGVGKEYTPAKREVTKAKTIINNRGESVPNYVGVGYADEKLGQQTKDFGGKISKTDQQTEIDRATNDPLSNSIDQKNDEFVGALYARPDDTTNLPKYPNYVEIEQQDKDKVESDRIDSLAGKIFIYPEDLGLNPELQNYIQFEMYEAGGTQLDSTKKSFSEQLHIPKTIFSVDTEKLKRVLDSNGTNTAVLLMGGLNSGVAGGLANVVSSGMGDSIVKSASNSFNAPTASQGKQSFGFVQEITGTSTANKRIKKTILLYMPTNLKTSYGVEYTEEDFTGLVNAMSDYGALKAIASTAMNLHKNSENSNMSAGLINAFKETHGRQALGAASELLSSKFNQADTKLKELRTVASRMVENPFIINAYKSTKRRNFEFTFRFAPRSEMEMITVFNIIKYFKKYALPRRLDDYAGRFLEYPAEFQIKFLHNGTENQFLPKIARCALKDITLTFGDEQFSTFAPIEGFGAPPTKVDMSLSFEELEVLTRDRIDQGY